MEIKRGPAKLQCGAESIGGTLVLDGRKLRFMPNAASAGRDPESIEISDIKRMRKARTKVLGVLPVVPNAVVLEMRNQEIHRFAVEGRKAWMETIEHAHADTPRG